MAICSTRTSKFLWMEERNSDIPHQLTNNRSSDSSVSDCTRQMGNCCVRGGSSNSSIDFANKVTLNHLSGEKRGQHPCIVKVSKSIFFRKCKVNQAHSYTYEALPVNFFHMNGHALGFGLQIQIIELYCTV